MHILQAPSRPQTQGLVWAEVQSHQHVGSKSCRPDQSKKPAFKEGRGRVMEELTHPLRTKSDYATILRQIMHHNGASQKSSIYYNSFHFVFHYPIITPIYYTIFHYPIITPIYYSSFHYPIITPYTDKPCKRTSHLHDPWEKLASQVAFLVHSADFGCNLPETGSGGHMWLEMDRFIHVYFCGH